MSSKPAVRPPVSPEALAALDALNGALVVHKEAGVSSFGVVEALQRQLMGTYGVRKRDLPKLGHGGTLDPFATGLLVVCVGKAVKLARYFLGSTKVYEGMIRFGETTLPGDPTDPISERSDVIPESIEKLRSVAHSLTLQPYLQTPPMHSAKKKDGRPLYELAREGLEVDREAKHCQLYSFEILEFTPPRASFRVACSSGTYIRTLSQDFARLLGTVGMLDTLHRSASGDLAVSNGMTVSEIGDGLIGGTPWNKLGCWIPFDRLLAGYDRVVATKEEAQALYHGRQNVLLTLLTRAKPPQTRPDHPVTQESCLVIVNPEQEIVAVARNQAGLWSLERVFPPG